jgi:hypothetical protein
MFRQSKRREVGKFDMKIDARYLGGLGALQKQSVGLGNRAAELNIALSRFFAIDLFDRRKTVCVQISQICHSHTSKANQRPS